MKILGSILALLFVVFTAVQYNDPDAGPWMVFYLLMAGLSGAAAFGRVGSTWLVVAMIALAFGIGRYYPGVAEFLTNDDGISFAQGMQDTHPYIEEAREFGGLTIAFLGMVGLWWLRRKSE